MTKIWLVPIAYFATLSVYYIVVATVLYCIGILSYICYLIWNCERFKQPYIFILSRSGKIWWLQCGFLAIAYFATLSMYYVMIINVLYYTGTLGYIRLFCIVKYQSNRSIFSLLSRLGKYMMIKIWSVSIAYFAILSVYHVAITTVFYSTVTLRVTSCYFVCNHETLKQVYFTNIII